MTPDMFLTDQELVRLTGYKIKSRQIAWLRSEAIPFRVSATGHPVVTRVAIEKPTRQEPAPLAEPWVPAVLQRDPLREPNVEGMLHHLSKRKLNRAKKQS
ncbi:hypothetical protein A3K87_09955 [Variovorax paradoxus]|uniref:DUF4224 domain-containing protein n=1 Tax=Variovorax paradoxus TaxID=34073 RepID=A0AA91DRJ6_VARPD|nr:DUF4224 domain-containing protein [Variovorax paradoxus]OAK66079.1 hypothetical protein A3K87_09955 [Variovorax paradoxus]